MPGGTTYPSEPIPPPPLPISSAPSAMNPRLTPHPAGMAIEGLAVLGLNACHPCAAQACLPTGTEVVLFSNRLRMEDSTKRKPDPAACAEFLHSMFGTMERLNLKLVSGDPLDHKEVEALQLKNFTCVIILCDKTWMVTPLQSS